MPEAADLPHIDEHAALVDAAPGATWEALLRTVESSVSAANAPRLARLLGCAEVVPGGPRPLAEGSTLPGFSVVLAEEPRALTLAGSHRFSEYALVFRLDHLDRGGTRLRAETRAEFPGLSGQAYKTMVIRTRGHVLVTRRLLEAARRRAERAGR
jgi:hypothetical protein